MKRENAVMGFKSIMREINHIHNIEEAMMWDTRVNLPHKGAAYRSELMGYLSGQKYKLKTSQKMKELLDELSLYSFEEVILNKMILVAQRDYNRLVAIPTDLTAKYAKHSLMTEILWQEARKKNDYDMVKVALKKSFDYQREFANCSGFGSNVMDYLLNQWEEGCNISKVDTIFEELKSYILPVLEKVRISDKTYSIEKIKGYYPRESQLQFIQEVTAAVGYDHEAGRIGESAHPFTLRLYPRDDIRFTTRLFENDFTNAMLSSLHESGHAMYAQNIAPELRGTTLAVGTSWGIDEGQARFFENFIGRSFEFWNHFYNLAKKYFPSLNMSVEEFYCNLNALSFGPLRLSADEMTYNLHIIIRYEIEKQFYEEELDIDSLPVIWADKYEEYLGIRPKNDSEGILQDVQWFSGWIGYYQNYVLANCYDGHFLYAMQKAIPDFWKQVNSGKFEEINAWHNEHIRQHGSLYFPYEILNKFSGETLSASHYINYLKGKYEPIYNL